MPSEVPRDQGFRALDTHFARSIGDARIPVDRWGFGCPFNISGSGGGERELRSPSENESGDRQLRMGSDRLPSHLNHLMATVLPRSVLEDYGLLEYFPDRIVPGRAIEDHFVGKAKYEERI
ncbi:MAG: hypothetical protein JWR80_6818 [Bradyrhizobium sp.]|nr:hypothetical protein [Bradyrhizobium sp.]